MPAAWRLTVDKGSFQPLLGGGGVGQLMKGPWGFLTEETPRPPGAGLEAGTWGIRCHLKNELFLVPGQQAGENQGWGGGGAEQ